jgi:ATP-dependent Clp protease adaptor protein ClpS
MEAHIVRRATAIALPDRPVPRRRRETTPAQWRARCQSVNGQVEWNGMSTTLEPTRVVDPDVDEDTRADRPWIVIVWNDPVNLMSYVTFVFQKLFGYSLEKATELMLDVHHKGKAVVASGTREEAEMHVFRLHEHSLWATMEHDE